MSAVVFDQGVHGQPLSRPRKRRCAPFAERLAEEQRDRSAQIRAHRALLHGVGTAWGLVAAGAGAAVGGRATRVIVSAGLATDALGREIYVDREQSLDVTGLVHHAIWGELAPPEAAPGSGLRRAYIVIRYEASPLDPPAGPHPPDDSGADTRPLERFRLELAAVPPEGTAALRRDCVAVFAAQDTPAHEGHIGLLTRDAPLAVGLPVRPDVAPLLLATVDLEKHGKGAAATVLLAPGTVLVPNPDNRPRAVLPDAGRVAEVLFGDRLPPRSRR